MTSYGVSYLNMTSVKIVHDATDAIFKIKDIFQTNRSILCDTTNMTDKFNFFYAFSCMN